VLPAFDSRGYLPPGVHRTNWQELARRFGNNGRRRRLLKGLKAVCAELKSAGCRTLYVDGSFVSDKALPGDFDGCWDYEGVDFSLLEHSTLLQFANKRAAQKAKYGGEMFLAHTPADQAGTIFLEFFQKDRDGNRKGIVALDLREFKP
jgi:hypothetical protein